MKSIPVLMYHHVAHDREISPEHFHSQMGWLRAQGYKTLSLSEFHAHITGARPVKEKAVLLTFDDGYADNWICAYPILKECEMKAAVFVTTARLDLAPRITRTNLAQGAGSPDTLQGERGPEGFLSWPELREMTASGVFEAGSHTDTHNNFNKESDYADIGKELADSSDKILANTGVKPAALAWPWGKFRPEWDSLLRARGYLMAFTAGPGPNVPGTDPLRICRFKVRKPGLDWLGRRIWLYENYWPAKIQSAVYGLDYKVKDIFRR